VRLVSWFTAGPAHHEIGIPLPDAA